jgi:hypothetical protein
MCYDNAARQTRAPARLIRPTIEAYADWGIAAFSLRSCAAPGTGSIMSV